MTTDKVIAAAKEAGFKIFGNSIVAAENGSSGSATTLCNKLYAIAHEAGRKSVEPVLVTLKEGYLCGEKDGRTSRDAEIDELQSTIDRLNKVKSRTEQVNLVKENEELHAQLKSIADLAFDTLGKPTSGYYRGLKLIMDTALSTLTTKEELK